nr:MAG: coat protein [Leviviridae sp.]
MSSNASQPNHGHIPCPQLQLSPSMMEPPPLLPAPSIRFPQPARRLNGQNALLRRRPAISSSLTRFASLFRRGAPIGDWSGLTSRPPVSSMVRRWFFGTVPPKLSLTSARPARNRSGRISSLLWPIFSATLA